MIVTESMLAGDTSTAILSTVRPAACRGFLAAGMLAALAELAGCGSSTSSSMPPAAAVPTHPVAATSFHVAAPIGLVHAAGQVWAVSAGSGRLVSLEDPSRVSPLQVQVGNTPLRATSYRHHIWVSVFGANRVVAVNLTTGLVEKRVAVAGQPEGITAAFGRIWVVRQAAGRLTSIRPDGHLQRTFRVGNEPRLVAAGDGGLFVSNFADGTITRVDPRTGVTSTSRTLCQGAQGLAVHKNAVWVACTTSGEVVAVDTRTLRPLGRVRIPDEPDAVRVASGYIYVASTTGPTLRQLAPDPRAPTILRTRKLGTTAALLDRANVDLAVVGPEFYVSSPDDNKVFRVAW